MKPPCNNGCIQLRARLLLNLLLLSTFYYCFVLVFFHLLCSHFLCNHCPCFLNFLVLLLPPRMTPPFTVPLLIQFAFTPPLSQGAVILSLLLLVLWLPPLIFSSGAPTYTTPGIVSIKLNVTISQVGGGGAALLRLYACVKRFFVGLLLYTRSKRFALNVAASASGIASLKFAISCRNASWGGHRSSVLKQM